jgi:hypothetical protein
MSGREDSKVCITLSLLSTFFRPINSCPFNYYFVLEQSYNLANLKIDLLNLLLKKKATSFSSSFPIILF